MTEQRQPTQSLLDYHLDDMDRQKVVRRSKISIVFVIAILLLGLVRALLVRQTVTHVLAEEARENATVHVRVVHPKVASDGGNLTLPSSLQGIAETQVYARTSGYVKRWYKDIGQTVKKGELMAELEVPDINKQVDEAAINFSLAKTEFERWSKLREHDAVSQQEFDEKLSTYKQTDAVLKRLIEQQNFGKVYAPFDGIVTRRNVENGALINAGNLGTGLALFDVAQIEKLHLYIHVPQIQSSQIHVGDEVQILRPEAPATPISGQVVRSAGAFDNTNRTLQLEVVVPNPDHTLLPGAYVDVSIKLKASSNLTLPVNSLLFRATGSQVALVDPDFKVKLAPVVLGIDYGHEVEILSGVKPEDTVMINPPDSITTGQKVSIVAQDTGKDH